MQRDDSWESLKVGAVAYAIQGGRTLESFLNRVDEWFKKARAEGVELLLFPELFVADLLPSGAKVVSQREEVALWEQLAREQFAPLLEGFERLSRHWSINTVFGSLPRWGDGAVLNSAPVVFQGRRPVLQDKLFITPCEDRIWKWQNGSILHRISAPWGDGVVLICHDVEVPQISQLLVEEAPEWILVPSCTGSQMGLNRVRWCSQARAVEHHAYVLQTSTLGPGPATPNMNEHTGQAALITPCDLAYEGMAKVGTLNQEELLVGSLDFGLLRKMRKQSLVYPARDQRGREVQPGVGRALG